MSNRPRSYDPAEDGIQGAREDAQRARDQKDALQKIARAQRQKRDLQKLVRRASGSANALNNALGYLNAALSELAEAEARIGGAVTEANLRRRIESAVVDAGLLDEIRGLRDARAEQAGFHFDDE